MYECLTSTLKAPINFSTFPAVIVSVYFNFTLAERSSDVAADRGRELPQARLSTNRRALAGVLAPARRGAGAGVCTVLLAPIPCFESLFWRLAEPGSKSSYQGFRFWLCRDFLVFGAIHFSSPMPGSMYTEILGESEKPTLFICLNFRACATSYRAYRELLVQRDTDPSWGM